MNIYDAARAALKRNPDYDKHVAELRLQYAKKREEMICQKCKKYSPESQWTNMGKEIKKCPKCGVVQIV